MSISVKSLNEVLKGDSTIVHLEIMAILLLFFIAKNK